MSKVVVFSGIDGSGKSTHAQNCLLTLHKQAVPVKYVYMRGKGRVFFSFPFLVMCRLLNITKIHKLKNGIKISDYVFYPYKPIKLLWTWLQLVDSLIYSLILVYLPKLFFKKIILMDRSVIDTLVDIIADTRNPNLGVVGSLYFSLLPKNSLVILFDVDEAVAMKRKKDVDDVNQLKIRRKAYVTFAKFHEWHVLSTQDDYTVVHEKLKVLLSDFGVPS